MLSFLNNKLIFQTLKWTDLTLVLFRGFETPVCHLIPHFWRQEGFGGHPVLLCSTRTQWLGLFFRCLFQLYLWAQVPAAQPLRLFLDGTVCVSVDCSYLHSGWADTAVLLACPGLSCSVTGLGKFISLSLLDSSWVSYWGLKMSLPKPHAPFSVWLEIKLRVELLKDSLALPALGPLQHLGHGDSIHVSTIFISS